MDKMSIPSPAEMQREYRDRMVAMKVAAEVMNDRLRGVIDGDRILERTIEHAVQNAAYLAIQEERKLHAEEIKMLDHLSNLRLESAMLSTPTITLRDAPSTTSG